MNAVGNQRLGVAYKSDDDLYNTKYKIEHAADQGYTPNLLIGLDGPRVACRIDDVKKPRLAVRQKYAISVPFRLASCSGCFPGFGVDAGRRVSVCSEIHVAEQSPTYDRGVSLTCTFRERLDENSFE